jgi:hypothetical protein
MLGEAFELPPPLISPVHTLRRTHAGIQTLIATNRYQPSHDEGKWKPFLSWDGEGWTDNDMQHRYMLLQNSTGTYIAAPQLRTVECLNFILKTGAANPGRIHVIFGGGYDATHILRDLTDEQRETLNTTNTLKFSHRERGKVVNRYRIEYIPHKWLSISGFDWTKRKNVTVKIFDVMTFFQSSFIKALESRQIAVPEIVVTGKGSRADFTYEDIDDVIQYCDMELKLLVELCNQLRKEFDEAGVYVTQWHGPGAVASAVFKERKVREHMQPPPPHIERALQRAYFGGRFEQFKAGHYEGKVYVYDINSAYPDKIRNLPSLAGATWKRVDTYSGKPGVYLASYHYPDGLDPSPHPLPWRGKSGNVGFPAHNTAVWVWHFEAEYATDVSYGYELVTANDVKPFSWLSETYLRRQEWKRLGKGGERALKLMMNSLYGKTAQRIGGSEKYGGRPAWHQLEWAGMITSATRAQIWEAIQQAPNSIIAVETDSVASTVPLNLDVGEGLGQWELKEYDWITYVQSGIYFASDGVTGTKAKSRGIDVKQLHHAEVINYLNNPETPLLVNSHQFIGMSNPQKTLYGQWTDGVKEVRVGGGKRIHLPDYCAACGMGLPMGSHMHDMVAAPHLGTVESAKHPLPWLDSESLAEPEMQYVDMDAIAEFETPRHSPFMPEGELADIPF